MVEAGRITSPNPPLVALLSNAQDLLIADSANELVKVGCLFICAHSNFSSTKWLRM